MSRSEGRQGRWDPNQTRKTHAQIKSTPNSGMICVDLLYVKSIPNGAIVPDHTYAQFAKAIDGGLKRSNHNKWLTGDQTLKIPLYTETETQIRLDEDKFPTHQLSSSFSYERSLVRNVQCITYLYPVRTVDNLTL